MIQWNLCPKVQCALGNSKQQIIVMVEPRAPKHDGSGFLMEVQAFHSCL